MNDNALANGDIRKFGGLAIFCDVRGCGGEFHVDGFAVLGFYGDRFRADFFDRSNDVLFVAVRESRQLARCAPDAPKKMDRPMYRGATVASVWLLFLLFALIAVQVPFTFIRLRGIENPEQAMALMQSLSQAKTPDALMIASDVASAVMNLVLRPLLAASFIVLYYDAKARRGD